MGNYLMNALRSSRPVYQNTQIQPMKGTVERVDYKAHSITMWSHAAAAIHATMDMLSAPVWGSTKPNDFISIQGVAPHAPIVVEVPTIAGSNAPQGGLIQ